MVLSEIEKRNLSEFLETHISHQDLFSLAQTVTAKLVLPESPSEAIQAILLHTEKSEDLLRRKKVKREILFKYLHRRRVSGVSAQDEKSVLISKILQHWESSASSPTNPNTSAMAAALVTPLSLAIGHHHSSSNTPSFDEESSMPEAPAPSRNTSYNCLVTLNDSLPNGVSAILNRANSVDRAALKRNLSFGGHRSCSNSRDSSLSRQNRGLRLEDDSSTVQGHNDEEMDFDMEDSSSQEEMNLNQNSQQHQQKVSTASSSSSSAALPNYLINGSSGSSGDSGCVTTPSHSPGLPPAASSSASQAQELADTFARWFYEMLNAHTTSGSTASSSSPPSGSSSSFKPDHFWPDASAKIVIRQQKDQSRPSDAPHHATSTTSVPALTTANVEHNPSSPIPINGVSLPNSDASADIVETVQVVNDGAGVCAAIADVAAKHCLVFNPNLCREGVRGAVDPHGLVLVMVCGTLHNGPSCCGTFQQQFGLIRDPTTKGNYWKIKHTQAVLTAYSKTNDSSSVISSGVGPPPPPPLISVSNQVPAVGASPSLQITRGMTALDR